MKSPISVRKIAYYTANSKANKGNVKSAKEHCKKLGVDWKQPTFEKAIRDS